MELSAVDDQGVDVGDASPAFLIGDAGGADTELARRQRWARRQGNPSWLWPEIPIDAWRDALGRIATAAGAVLQGLDGARLEGDPHAISLAGYTSGMGPLLGWWIAQGRLKADPAVAGLLGLHLRHNARRAERMDRAAHAIAASLTGHGIDVAMLKGAHTTTYFPHPGTRPASDIDLLVRRRDALAAELVLEAAGFARESESRFESGWRPAGARSGPLSLFMVHEDDPWTIDLHHSLDLFVSAGARVARLDEGKPMDGPEGWRGIARARTLGQPLLLLHLAVHAGTGLQSLSLLRLVELALVIRQDEAAGRLRWGDFLALAARTSSLGYAYPALRLCEALAEGTVPRHVLDACARAAPARARAVVAQLDPSSAHRVGRSSIGEHFMWVRGPTGWARQLAADLVPARSWSGICAVYGTRGWQVVRGTFSR